MKSIRKETQCAFPHPYPVKYIKMRFPLLHSTAWGGFGTYWHPNLTRDAMHDPVTPVSQLLTRTRRLNRNHRHTCRGSGKKAQQMQALKLAQTTIRLSRREL
ncbi:unnamed protein product [Rangifer tarandus platyrhynchus]|uniref:Uncharacterized protein n=2 Tax=Rangifer tarandus platyrhynchus TaxID=3082113 RepID=A0ABN8ZTE2_RANTA|nr:unnamed protein product [Rangifer tarandus platyrhynchus]